MSDFKVFDWVIYRGIPNTRFPDYVGRIAKIINVTDSRFRILFDNGKEISGNDIDTSLVLAPFVDTTLWRVMNE